MEDRASKLNMSKMPWAFRHSLTARLALKIPIYCSHSRIHEPTRLRLSSRLIENLWMLNLRDRVCFLKVVT